MKNLNDWLKNIEQLHPNEIELGLDRIKSIASKLGLLHPSAKVILVGGTNGKGSCVATIESLARLAGLQVGCYTSPHLLLFNERVKVNGANVDDSSLVEAFEQIEGVRGQVALTFFEFTTLAALYCFSKSKLDLLVLEIGLGGRLDAVNIIQPDVSIITTIDRDHEAWLGSDLLSIAKEKSGIYRANSLNFVGDRRSQQLLDKIDLGSVSSPLLAEQYLSEQQLSEQLVNMQLDLILADHRYNPFKLLRQNVECAIAAFYHLYSEIFDQLELSAGLANIQITGRFQQISDSPVTILDVGHNEQSAKNLASQLDSLEKPKLRIAICGLMADKAIAKFLSALEQAVDVWIFADLPGERAANAQEIKSIYQSIATHGKSEIAESVATAYQVALALTEQNKQILVIGSFITVAEMLHYYQKT